MAEARKRVLGAARLSRSTDESTSIERQEEQIRHACRSRDDLVLADIAKDTDVSGAVSPFEREQLGEWLRERTGEFDVIMVAKLDRLTRSLGDFADLVKWCGRNGKAIISVAESIDLTNGAGRLLAHILALFAQFERERIGERRAEAAAKLASKGLWGGGKAVPWGYMPVKSGDHWELAPDPEVAPVVVRTVDAVISGQSVRRLATALRCDGKGLADRLRSRTLTGHVEVWRPAREGEDHPRARRMTDKAAGGTVVMVPDVVRDDEGLPVRREALISDERFALLQKVLDGRKAVQVNRFDTPLLFHVAHCAGCGAVLYGNQHRDARRDVLYRYYRHRVSTTHPLTCAVPGSVNADTLEAAFTAELLSRYGSRPVLEEIEHPAEDHTAELERVNAAIAEWEGTAVSGGASAASVLRILDGLYAKRSRLEGMEQKEAWTEYIDTGRDLSDEWEAWSTAERNSYLRSMGVQVRVAKGQEPACEWGLLEGGKIDWKALMEKARGAA